MLRHWFRTLLNCNLPTTRTRRPASRRPLTMQVEMLEDRLTPALTVTNLDDVAVRPVDLVSKILGPGILVNNVKFQGQTGADDASAGLFEGGGGDNGIHLDCGVVLSTGLATDVEGPNDPAPISTTVGAFIALNKSTLFGLPGDADLNKIVPANTPTYDASVLEFDFVPKTNMIEMKYVFSSEEYIEFVGSAFNDAFGIFVNGGNNLAALPNGQAVNINNTNLNVNTQYFFDNQPIGGTPFYDTAMDGFTVTLTLRATVNAGMRNHMKIAVADTGDQRYDTAVFIQGGSLRDVGTPRTRHDLVAAGADFGAAPHVKIFEAATGNTLASFFAYDPAFRGGVRTALGDVNGDGVLDLLTAAGPTGGPHVKVFSGNGGAVLYDFFVFSPAFTGGINIASGDLDADGFDDIIIAADQANNSHPHVRAFSGKDLTLLRDFFAYGIGFTGGVRVAVGDINGDGFNDIVTGAGPSAAPHVRAFSGFDSTVLRDFFAFDANFNGGVYVDVGDFQLDARDVKNACDVKFHQDIVVSAGAGANPHVKVFDGLTGAMTRQFFADVSGYLHFQDGGALRSGVRVATVDVNKDGIDEIMTSFGFGSDPVIKVFDWTSTLELTRYNAFDVQHRGGVTIGGG